MAEALAGRRVWLTRPSGQNADWAQALRAAGAEVDVAPLLAIDAPTDPDAADRALARAERAAIVIATSRNAVAGAWRLRSGFAPRGTLYGVGPASAAALAEAAGAPAAQPERADSESLVALPALADVAGAEVAVLAGEGGRALIGETLSARGARLDKIAVYRRRNAPIGAPRLESLLTRCDAVVVTSVDAMTSLISQVAALARVQPGPRRVIVPSRRVGQAAPAWLDKPLLMKDMSAQALVDALAQSGAGH